MTGAKRITPPILIFFVWISCGYCEGEEPLCTDENQRLCFLLCDSYRREIDLCSYFPVICESRINCAQVAYRCWNSIPDCGSISIGEKSESKRGAPTRGFAFLFLKLHPLFSQNTIPRLSTTSTRFRRIGQRFGSEFLGKRSDINFPPSQNDSHEDNLDESEEEFDSNNDNKLRTFYDQIIENGQGKRGKNSKSRIGSEFLGKRNDDGRQEYLKLPNPNRNRILGNELLGKREKFYYMPGNEFLGKRGTELLGKRGLEFLGKRGFEFLGKRGTEFLGKRATELLGKRGTEFLGKRGTEFLGKRGTELLGKRNAEFLEKRNFEFLGKRNFEDEDMAKLELDDESIEDTNATDANALDLRYPHIISKRGKGHKIKLGSEFLGKRSENQNPSLFWVRYPFEDFGEPEYKNFVKNDGLEMDKKYKMNTNLNQKNEKLVRGKAVSVSEFLG